MAATVLFMQAGKVLPLGCDGALHGCNDSIDSPRLSRVCHAPAVSRVSRLPRTCLACVAQAVSRLSRGCLALLRVSRIACFARLAAVSRLSRGCLALFRVCHTGCFACLAAVSHVFHAVSRCFMTVNPLSYTGHRM